MHQTHQNSSPCRWLAAPTRKLRYKEIEKTELKDEIFKEEAPAILHWMIEGAKKVIKDGLGSCEPIAEASSEYLKEQDKLQQFIDDCFLVDPTFKTGEPLTDITDVYNEWAEANGEMRANRYFGQTLEEKALAKSKTNGRTYIRGVLFSQDGMEFMSGVLRNRIAKQEAKKLDPKYADLIQRLATDRDDEWLQKFPWYEKKGRDRA